MSGYRRLALLVCAVLLGVGLLAESLAHARPGGGHSYSGGGSSGGGSWDGGGSSGGGSWSGGSSGGGSWGGRSRDGRSSSEWDGYSSSSYSSSRGNSGGAPPGFGLFGVLVVGVILCAGMLLDREWRSASSFDSHDDFTPDDFPPDDFPPDDFTATPPTRAIDWNRLRRRDPQFSAVVFQDFVYQLYARLHEARNSAEAMASLAPYVVAPVRRALAAREPGGARDNSRVGQVVLGSMQVTSLQLGERETSVVVRFESNLGVEHPDGRRSTCYVVEEWQLTRDAEVLSKAPELAAALKCPNCAGPFESTDDQRCGYCGEVVGNGRFDWHVTRTRLLQSEQRPPALGGYAPEVGTDLPTLVSPSFAKQWQRLLADDPELTQEALTARIQAIYHRLNIAWVSRDLSLARPYLSDGIYDYLRYWIEAYRRQGLVNCLEDMEIERIEPVKLTRDAWYDALTVRLFASGLDYTIGEVDGDLVGGSRRKPRRYSEYWTLIRGAGVRGEALSDHGCPNCGAPLTVNMAGNCEHCSAHLTRGEFDWVLSRIEQDESYLG
jgi:hypothetical protein